MDVQQEEPAEGTVPLFDVVVRMKNHLTVEDVERMGRDEAGMQEDRLTALIKVLKSAPQAKVGASVTRERADKAREQLGKAGLIVEITPVLTLGAMIKGPTDGLEECPACNKRVKLPENRQCPACGVFVDKVTSDVLLRRKLMEQERSKMDSRNTRDAKESERRTREQLEANMREQIREELEAKYGKGGGGRKVSKVQIALLVLLVGGAFAGGKVMSPGGMANLTGGEKPAAKGTSAAEVDKMLDSVGPKGGDGSGVPGGSTGEPDVDDMIIAASAGKKPGGKTLTVEQAVAASQALARSVGNKTGQGGGGGGAAGAAGAAGADGAAAEGAPAAVPPQTKILLSVEFARQLAELGQAARAAGVINSLKASQPAQNDPVTASAVRVADLEVRAWAMQGMAGSAARSAADGLMSQGKNLPDAAERTHALARVGAILARNPQLPTDAARAFLTESSEALKAVSDPAKRMAAASDWAVALGELLATQTMAHAKAGAWNKAKSAAATIDELVSQAPDEASQMRLYALAYQAQQQLGNKDKAMASLNAALGLIGKTASVSGKALQLRAVGRLSQAGATEQLQAPATALEAQATAATGMERAQALVALSLLSADAGMRAKANELGQLAQATPGLSPADSVLINTDLLVRSDLAAAKVLHGIGMYSEAETVLQRLGGYLL